MKAFTKFLAGGVGLAALTAAAPAAAQYYPGYPGGGYGGYGQGGVVGSILDSILGGQRYANNDRYAIDMCVRSTEARLNGYGGSYGGYGAYGNQGYGGYGGYGNQGYGGYNQPYGGQYGYNQYGGARVVRITHVERRSNGGLKVYGLADANQAGAYGNYGGYDQRYGGWGGYNSYGGGAAYRFNCKIDVRGRVTDVDIDRNNNYSRRYR